MRARWVAAAMCVLALGQLAACASSRGASAPKSVGLRLPARGLFATSPDQFDRVVRASDGLPTVVNAWASWCIPCQREKPLLRAAAEKYAGRVRFVGLNTQDDRASAEAFAERYRLPYASGFDPKGVVMRHLRILGLPTTLFYRPDGELGLIHSGEIDADALESKITTILTLARPAKDSRRKDTS